MWHCCPFIGVLIIFPKVSLLFLVSTPTRTGSVISSDSFTALYHSSRCAVNTTAEGREGVETALEGFCDSLSSGVYEESSHVKVFS